MVGLGEKKKGKDGTCLYIIWGLRARGALQAFREASQVERSALRSNWPSTNAAGTSAAVAACCDLWLSSVYFWLGSSIRFYFVFLYQSHQAIIIWYFHAGLFLLADDGLLHIRWPPGYSQYIPSVSFLRIFDVPPPGRLYYIILRSGCCCTDKHYYLIEI